MCWGLFLRVKDNSIAAVKIIRKADGICGKENKAVCGSNSNSGIDGNTHSI